MTQAAAVNSLDDNLLFMSSHKRRRSLLPQDLITDTFSVTRQLQENPKAYAKGKATINTRVMPTYLVVFVQKFRRLIELHNGRNPAMDPVYSCLLSHGMKLLEDHGQIQLLNKLKDELYTAETSSLPQIEMVHTFLGNFNATFISSSSDTICVRVPRYLHEDLTGLADTLGMPYGNTFVLAVLLSLMSQDELEKKQRERIHEVLKEFFILLRAKLAMVESLLGSL